jgi:hypothetical protein
VKTVDENLDYRVETKGVGRQQGGAWFEEADQTRMCAATDKKKKGTKMTSVATHEQKTKTPKAAGAAIAVPVITPVLIGPTAVASNAPLSALPSESAIAALPIVPPVAANASQETFTAPASAQRSRRQRRRGTFRYMLTDDIVDRCVKDQHVDLEEEHFTWAKSTKCRGYHESSDCDRGFRCGFLHNETRIRLSESYFLLVTPGSHTYTLERVPKAMQNALGKNASFKFRAVQKTAV